MSLFLDATATCGQCGKATQLMLAASVNADRRPDLRAEIVAGDFQARICPNCEILLRLPAHLSFLDMGRGSWILTEGVERFPEWRLVEAGAQAIFAQLYGDHASPLARELGKGLRPRLVFGWAALREKLICDDLDLDDVVLELLKLAMIRANPVDLDEQQELRLVGGDAAELQFIWINSATEAHGSGTMIDRSLYNDIAADNAPWAKLRARLTEGMFIDVRRLFLGNRG